MHLSFCMRIMPSLFCNKPRIFLQQNEEMRKNVHPRTNANQTQNTHTHHQPFKLAFSLNPIDPLSFILNFIFSCSAVGLSLSVTRLDKYMSKQSMYIRILYLSLSFKLFLVCSSLHYFWWTVCATFNCVVFGHINKQLKIF